jgi:hypothetical protein
MPKVYVILIAFKIAVVFGIGARDAISRATLVFFNTDLHFAIDFEVAN